MIASPAREKTDQPGQVGLRETPRQSADLMQELGHRGDVAEF
jgi:hypothetical protein